MKENRLGLIVHRVAGEHRLRADAVREQRERSVPERPKVGLRDATACRMSGRIEGGGPERDIQATGQRLHGRHVVCVVDSDAMLHMANRDRPSGGGCGCDDRMCEARAVRAT